MYNRYGHNQSVTEINDSYIKGTLREASRGAQIVLWPGMAAGGVARLHAQQAIFRAIENGVSLIRQDSTEGLSVATDPYGRVLATMDTHTASERVMVVQVPTQRVFTVYSVIGDLCLAGYP
jgi:apolipoprotein N-acyltransferase